MSVTCRGIITGDIRMLVHAQGTANPNPYIASVLAPTLSKILMDFSSHDLMIFLLYRW